MQVQMSGILGCPVDRGKPINVEWEVKRESMLRAVRRTIGLTVLGGIFGFMASCSAGKARDPPLHPCLVVVTGPESVIVDD
jgi:hypothetical protein